MKKYKFTYDYHRRFPPILHYENEEYDNFYQSRLANIDPDLYRIYRHTIFPDPTNREIGFWIEPVCHTTSYILASSILGREGVIIKSDSEEAVDLIKSFNKNINQRGENINQFFVRSFIDNIIHGYSMWRILKTKDQEHLLDIARVDPKTLTVLDHRSLSYLKFIQETQRFLNEPRTKNQFYSSNYDPHNTYPVSENIRIHIPVESTIYIKLFDKPPMAPCLHYVVFKRLMIWFMRKVAEKYGVPLLIGTMGNENYELIYSREELQVELNDWAKNIAKMRNFGVVTLPWWMNLDEKHLGKELPDYVSFLDYINSEIIFTIMASVGLLTPQGKESLASSKTQEEIFFMSIYNFRRQFSLKMEKFYELLCQTNNVKFNQIEIDFSPIKSDPVQELVRSACDAYEHNAFVDLNEFRESLRVIYPHLKKLEGKENKKIEDILKEKSERMQSMFQPGDKSSGIGTNQVNKGMRSRGD